MRNKQVDIYHSKKMLKFPYVYYSVSHLAKNCLKIVYDLYFPKGISPIKINLNTTDFICKIEPLTES